jgi:hypothetical protein
MPVLQLEYFILGHSDDTADDFDIPYNASLIFYAEEHTECFVPNDQDSLKIVIGEMQEFTAHNTPKKANNYEITFGGEFDGIFKVTRNGLGEIASFEKFIENPPNKLSDCINSIQRKNMRQNSKIYCIFCRGSENAFGDHDFGEFPDDFSLPSENYDFGDFSEDDNPVIKRRRSGSLGGKYKSKTRKIKRKNKTRKIKRKNKTRKIKRKIKNFDSNHRLKQ